MQDVEQIFGEFGLGTSHVCIENHEFTTASTDNEINDLPAKSRKAVSVGNHKLDTLSAYRSFQ